jgi:hypothetical protein
MRFNSLYRVSYLKHLKLSLKDDSRKELDYLIKDRMAYIHALFFGRLAELKSYPRTLHNIVLRNPDKPEVSKQKSTTQRQYNSAINLQRESVRRRKTIS